MLTTEEITESVLAGNQAVNSSSEEKQELVVALPKMPDARQDVDALIQFVDGCDDSEINPRTPGKTLRCNAFLGLTDTLSPY